MSVVRALQVLRLLAAAPGPLPAAALAAQLGAPRGSTYRLLRTMSDEGFVVHFPEESRWGLGVATFEVGQAYLRRPPPAPRGPPRGGGPPPPPPGPNRKRGRVPLKA